MQCIFEQSYQELWYELQLVTKETVRLENKTSFLFSFFAVFVLKI